MLCRASKKMKGRNEDKHPIYLSTSCCLQKLDEMEKNGNYRPAKEEENGTARHGKLTASWAMTKDTKPQTSTAAISKYLTMQPWWHSVMCGPFRLLIHQ